MIATSGSPAGCAGDLLLAGFDDQPIAELLPVPLTTIRFPVEPFANVCYERLLKQMADPSKQDGGLTLMNVELVLRASSGCDATEQSKMSAAAALETVSSL